MTVDFVLPAGLEAHEPPEARDAARDLVALLVSKRATGEISHHAFGELPGLLLPGDLIVVNTSATLPAAVRPADAPHEPRCPQATQELLQVIHGDFLPRGDFLEIDRPLGAVNRDVHHRPQTVTTSRG